MNRTWKTSYTCIVGLIGTKKIFYQYQKKEN